MVIQRTVDEMLEASLNPSNTSILVQKNGFVIMEDKFNTKHPMLFLENYLTIFTQKHFTTFILERNLFIKALAENHQK
jgi:hypothetical protein